MSYNFPNRGEELFKCQACGWLHARIPLEEAEHRAALRNESLNRMGSSKPRDDLSVYFRCRKCGASVAGFVPGTHADAPFGVELPWCVIELPDPLAEKILSRKSERAGAVEVDIDKV